jgi:ribokinase
MTRVAVVGHIEWVDFVPVERFPLPGEVVHARGTFAKAAGGGGVVAGVLAQLGAEVDLFTALGRDWHGQAAVSQLSEHGVNMHVAWREQLTRRAVTLLEPDGERTIVTLGERLEPAGDDALEWGRLGDADGVYFTAGDPDALKRARAGRVLVVSPRARAALEAEGPAVDAFVFSSRDRGEGDWAARAADRTSLFLATDGANGGRWWGESEGAWSAAELPGEPRDAYGCGDSFAAGFTLGLSRGLSVPDAAALGASAGARCLTRSGAP